MQDNRIVYGATCLWWDSIDKVINNPIPPRHKLPCCPFCGGVLLEVKDEEEWERQLQAIALITFDKTYRDFMYSRRGLCSSFPFNQRVEQISLRDVMLSKVYGVSEAGSFPFFVTQHKDVADMVASLYKDYEVQEQYLNDISEITEHRSLKGKKKKAQFEEIKELFVKRQRIGINH
jgi:hypothetical protein